MNAREVLQSLLDSKGLSVAEVAKRTHTVRSTLYSLLNGANEDPRDKTLQPYAQFFGVSLAQLRGYEPIEGLTEKSAAPNEYPLLNDEDIPKWLQSQDREFMANIVKSSHPKGLRTFVYRSMDGAMAPLIPEGGTAFVDPDYDATRQATGPMIVLISANGRHAFRLLSNDFGAVIYKPIGSGFRTITEEEASIVGYVTGIPESNFEDPDAARAILNTPQ